MRRKNLKLLAAAAVIGMQLLTACGGSPGTQKAAEAVAALRKIHAATEVGVNYQQYGMLLIEAKAKVNDANAVLPDGELKNRLNAAVDAYTDASQVWGMKINGPPLSPDKEPGATLMRKYNLKTHTISAAALTYIDPEEAMRAMWGAAMGHLLMAQKQLEG
jgi:hypothetical protein